MSIAPAKTSESHPIRVDFLPGAAHGLAGRIGLTFAPGKKDCVKGWERDLAEDLSRLREVYDTSLLVSLVENHELTLLGITDLEAEAARASIRLPIPDAHAPPDVEGVHRVVGDVLEAAGAGETVVIHCRGGLGRAGTIAACCLVARGMAAEEAIRVVRAARVDAIETRSQEEFIRRFATTARS